MDLPIQHGDVPSFFVRLPGRVPFFQMIFPMDSPLLRSELFQAAMHKLLETRQRQQAVQFLGPEKVGEVAI